MHRYDQETTMTDLNGSLTRASNVARRATPGVIVAVCGLSVLAACHDDKTTAPLTAKTITVVSGGSQSGSVGAALAAPVVLQVNDQDGNALPGATVTLTAAANSGSLSAASMASDANGQVTVTWTLGTVAGTDTLAAQVGSLSALNVLATATPGAPASLVIVSGDNQSATAGTALGAPLVIKVVDQYGNAVPGAAVTFSDDANGTLAASSLTSDGTGTVSDTITLGAAAGTDDVTATIQTANGPVSVTLHETGS
jgi:hypothetical protein